MRDDSKNYIIVGTFVLSMVVAVIVWITSVSGPADVSDDYHIFFENVYGLKEGVEILYEGYPVGLIHKISHSGKVGDSFRIDVKLRHHWEVAVDSEAVIRSGLFSASVVDISAGESTEKLALGSQIPSREAVDALAQVGAAAAAATGLVENTVQPLLEDVSARLPEIVANVEEVSRELATATGQVNALLDDENVGRVRQVLLNMETGTGEVNQVIHALGTTRSNVDGLILKLDNLLEDNNGDVAVALADLRYSLATLSRHIDAIGANLETTTRNLNEASREVREDPSVLLRGRQGADDEL